MGPPSEAPATLPHVTYRGRCHCGAVDFAFRSLPIARGLRCNCSMCARKGIVMTQHYVAADDFELRAGAEALTVYRFGDHFVDHAFCRICGIAPFTRVCALPDGYDGPAWVGSRRINLGCVDALDACALPVDLVDGRSF